MYSKLTAQCSISQLIQYTTLQAPSPFFPSSQSQTSFQSQTWHDSFKTRRPILCVSNPSQTFRKSKNLILKFENNLHTHILSSIIPFYPLHTLSSTYKQNKQTNKQTRNPHSQKNLITSQISPTQRNQFLIPPKRSNNPNPSHPNP